MSSESRRFDITLLIAAPSLGGMVLGGMTGLIQGSPTLAPFGVGFGLVAGIVMVPVHLLCLWRKDVFTALSWTNMLAVVVWLVALFFLPPIKVMLAVMATILVACVVLRYCLSNVTDKDRNMLCSSCDYDLTGNVSGICPECGTSISTSKTDAKSQARKGTF